MQNKNKNILLTTILHLNTRLFSHKFAKIAAECLILIISLKVLTIGTLFFLPRNHAFAETGSAITNDKLIQLTNKERAKKGLPLVDPNKTLTEAADKKAAHLLEEDYFAHTAPSGKPFYLWIQEADYLYRSAGENLAISFFENEDIMTAWMESPTHRDNILDPYYQEIGISVVTGEFEGKETTVVVQLFGEPLSPRAVLPTTPLGATDTKHAIVEGVKAEYSYPVLSGRTSVVYSLDKALNVAFVFILSLLSIIIINQLIIVRSVIKGRAKSFSNALPHIEEA